MLKRLGLTTLALAAAIAVASPTVTLARDRDNDHGRTLGWQDSYGHNNRVYTAPRHTSAKNHYVRLNRDGRNPDRSDYNRDHNSWR